MTKSNDFINQIRQSSRTIVRELGFINNEIASTHYHLSALHTLIEINRQQTMTSMQIGQFLKLEKSSVSRLIQKLIQMGELKEEAHKEDGRIKQLFLTEKGKQTVNHINHYAHRKISSAIKHLKTSELQQIVQGLSLYAQALQQNPLTITQDKKTILSIQKGYQSGLIGKVTEMHTSFYHQRYKFGLTFEKDIATSLAEFINRIENPCNHIWTIMQNDQIIGSIAIDGEDLGNNNAHLRWFMIDNCRRGSGIGRKLLDQAITFCKKARFHAIFLWTFKDLNAAIKLYHDFGFELIHEQIGNQWDKNVIEQQYCLILQDKV